FAPSGRSCIHVFEKESILAQLDRLASSSYGRGRGGQESIPCPFVGCRSTICRQDLERDLETLVHLRQEKIRHAQEALNKLPAVHTPSAA
ncbi:the miz type in nse subunit zinc-finger protein, partial [Cystoisospora suis]